MPLVYRNDFSRFFILPISLTVEWRSRTRDLASS
ncbi:Uncharacterised protein [Mycobacterium tuberculosis]|nr:Uncharacterised protein [Mycobacterium tuberculosis]